MIVEPGLPDDPKYLRLKKGLRTLDETVIAFEVLIRLWAHCQANQRGEYWPKADADYVECVCRWDGAEGKLFELLTTRGWIDLENDGVRIHDWNDMNASLVACWSNGKFGGKRKKKRGVGLAAGSRRLPDGQPTGNPPATDGQPMGDPIEGGIEREREGVLAPKGSDSESDFPEVSWPTEQEVCVECTMRGIPEAVGTKFWIFYESKSPKWGGIGNWKTKLRGWWIEEQTKNGRPGGAASAGNAAALTQLEAELDVERDQEKRRVLMEKIRKMKGGL